MHIFSKISASANAKRFTQYLKPKTVKEDGTRKRTLIFLTFKILKSTTLDDLTPYPKFKQKLPIIYEWGSISLTQSLLILQIEKIQHKLLQGHVKHNS